jgi:hypothetical protein
VLGLDGDVAGPDDVVGGDAGVAGRGPESAPGDEDPHAPSTRTQTTALPPSSVRVPREEVVMGNDRRERMSQIYYELELVRSRSARSA